MTTSDHAAPQASVIVSAATVVTASTTHPATTTATNAATNAWSTCSTWGTDASVVCTDDGSPVGRPALDGVRIVLRGGGDIATGVALRLHRAGFRKLVVLEMPHPLAVRRSVALCEAVPDGASVVEGLVARRVDARGEGFFCELETLWGRGEVPVLVDPEAAMLAGIAPHVLIEVTLAKRNVGVRLGDAPLVIGVGPGFEAGRHVTCVVESNRGARLGRVLDAGWAEPDTGIPGEVGGFSAERILRASVEGLFVSEHRIGDLVEAGQEVARVDGAPICTRIGGTLRGLLRSGTPVRAGLKVGDVDPRPAIDCHEVSDKALSIGGGVLEAVMRWYTEPLTVVPRQPTA